MSDKIAIRMFPGRAGQDRMTRDKSVSLSVFNGQFEPSARCPLAANGQGGVDNA